MQFCIFFILCPLNGIWGLKRYFTNLYFQTFSSYFGKWTATKVELYLFQLSEQEQANNVYGVVW